MTTRTQELISRKQRKKFAILYTIVEVSTAVKVHRKNLEINSLKGGGT